jgi:hypothetical protein
MNMPDQWSEVVTFIWNKHPELDPEDISKCVDAIGEWVVEIEKTDADSRDSRNLE